MDEVRAAFARIAGTDFGMCEQRWSSRFLSERRQAREYRVGRVFLAGDAAHVHSPLGGQGMNTGMQDAMNLGWKLAAAVRDRAPSGLLDTYHVERHRVGAQVLAMTDGFNRLVDGSSAIRRAMQARVVRLLLWFGPTHRRLIGRLTGIGIAYAGPRHSHPWTGRRVPDLATEDGSSTNCSGTAGSCSWTSRAQARPSTPFTGHLRRCARCAEGARLRAGHPRRCWCARTATSPGQATTNPM
jgi:hypothetical protein